MSVMECVALYGGTEGRLVLQKASVSWEPLLRGVEEIKKKVYIQISEIESTLKAKEKNARAKVVLQDGASYIFDFKGKGGQNLWEQMEKFAELLMKQVAEERKRKEEEESQIKELEDSKNQRNRILEQKKQTQSQQQKIDPLVRERHKMLQDSKELFRLHKELVITGLVESEEFWEMRESMLGLERARPNLQKKGMRNEVVEVKGSTAKANVTIYTLTKQSIYQTFLNYPAVHTAFIENVPHNMTAQEFWDKFYRSRYFHRDRGSGMNTDQDKDMFAEYQERHDKLAMGRKKKIDDVDKSIDLTTTEKFHHGFGLLEETNSAAAVQNTAAKNLIEKYNRHGKLVLSGSEGVGDVAQLNNMHEVGIHSKPTGELEGATWVSKKKRKFLEEAVDHAELKRDLTEDYQPLQIADRKRYFETLNETAEQAQSSSAACPPSGAAAVAKSDEANARNKTNLDAIVDEANGFKADVSAALPSPECAQRVIMKEINMSFRAGVAASADGQNFDADAPGSDGVAARGTFHLDETTIPPAVRAELEKYFIRTCELLRHYWSCHPVVSAELQAKMNRIVASMKVLFTELTRVTQDKPAEVRAWLHHAVKPMMDTLNKANEHYQMYEKRMQERNARKKAASPQPGAKAPVGAK